MPIYEFECTACSHRFDELMRLSDPEPAVCPSCGAAQVRKRLSAPQFRLAGGGWYETDFKKDGDSKRNLAGDGGDAKPADGGAKPAEGGAKPAEGGAKPAEGGAKPSDGGAKPEGTSSGPKASESTPAAKPAPPAGGD